MIASRFSRGTLRTRRRVADEGLARRADVDFMRSAGHTTTAPLPCEGPLGFRVGAAGPRIA